MSSQVVGVELFGQNFDKKVTEIRVTEIRATEIKETKIRATKFPQITASSMELFLVICTGNWSSVKHYRHHLPKVCVPQFHHEDNAQFFFHISWKDFSFVQDNAPVRNLIKS